VLDHPVEVTGFGNGSKEGHQDHQAQDQLQVLKYPFSTTRRPSSPSHGHGPEGGGGEERGRRRSLSPKKRNSEYFTPEDLLEEIVPKAHLSGFETLEDLHTQLAKYAPPPSSPVTLRDHP
jgi:hypothetical protein